MENPTPFSLNEAIHRWRAEFGGSSSLSAAELEELEAHLHDHVAQLEASGVKPEAAFAVAVRQLGERQRVETEFAKINPQRIWLERAIWMAVGVFLLWVFERLVAAPSNPISNYGCTRQWNPALCFVVSRFYDLGGVVVMAVLFGFVFTRKPAWGKGLGRFCERKPLWAGIAMVLVLWGCDRSRYLLHYFSDDVLGYYLPRLHAWLFQPNQMPFIQTPIPDEIVMNRISMFCGIAENVIWAAVLCMLAVRVVRRRQSLPPAAGTQRIAATSLWLERFMWMVAGCVLVTFGGRDLYGWVLLPALWVTPALGSSALLQHLLGFALATLHLALWATPFWVCWVFTSWRPRVGGWMVRAFQHRPFWSSVGVILLLNVNWVLWLLFLWTGFQIKTPGNGFGPIISGWHFGSWMSICQRFAPAILVVALVRWRMKLRETESRCQRTVDL